MRKPSLLITTLLCAFASMLAPSAAAQMNEVRRPAPDQKQPRWPIGMQAKSERAATTQGTLTPTGFSVTPTAAPGSVFSMLNPALPGLASFEAGQPMTTAVSPDGKTMLVLTSGYNLYNAPDGGNRADASNEYVLVYDISANKMTQLGAIPIPAAYAGIVWNPNGREFYVSGGAGDLIFVFTASQTGFGLGATIKMNHPNPTGFGSGNGRRRLS